MSFSEGQESRVGCARHRRIKIIVNGKERFVAESTTVLGLLNELDIKQQGIAVDLNLEIAPKSKFAETILKDGDKIEIVRMVGGG